MSRNGKCPLGGECVYKFQLIGDIPQGLKGLERRMCGHCPAVSNVLNENNRSNFKLNPLGNGTDAIISEKFPTNSTPLPLYIFGRNHQPTFLISGETIPIGLEEQLKKIIGQKNLDAMISDRELIPLTYS